MILDVRIFKVQIHLSIMCGAFIIQARVPGRNPPQEVPPVEYLTNTVDVDAVNDGYSECMRVCKTFVASIIFRYMQRSSCNKYVL